VNPNGTISVSGTAEPKKYGNGNIPWRTTGTFVADASGNYGPVTMTPQTSGQITATAKDIAGT
jgi:hypothetical protein